MKRDLELVRKILEDIESVDRFKPGFIELETEDYPDQSVEQLQYHLFIMHEAGLIDGIDGSTLGQMTFKPKRLTWQGHEFLSAAKNDSVWKASINKVGGRFGNVPFRVLEQLLIKGVANQLGAES